MESTNPASETADRTTVQSTDPATPKPTAMKAAATAKPTAVAAKPTAVATTAVATTAVATTATAGRCDSWSKSDRCTDGGSDGNSDDCFSNHGKSSSLERHPRDRGNPSDRT